jgi:hypothetical protein
LAYDEGNFEEIHAVLECLHDQVGVLRVDDPDLAINQFELFVEKAIIVEESLRITDD